MYKTLYIWKNPLIPDLIKVGITKDDIVRRLTRLTDFPEPIELIFTINCKDASKLEKKIKEEFQSDRYKNRFNHFTEFYRIECCDDLILFAQEQCNLINDRTHEIKEKGDSVSSSFYLAKLKKGDVLSFKIPVESKEPIWITGIKVCDVRNNKVKYDGIKYSLVELMKKLHKDNEIPIKNPTYNSWSFFLKVIMKVDL